MVSCVKRRYDVPSGSRTGLEGWGLSEEVEVLDFKETICYREAGPKDGKGMRSNQGCLWAVLTEGIQILVTPVSHIAVLLLSALLRKPVLSSLHSRTHTACGGRTNSLQHLHLYPKRGAALEAVREEGNQQPALPKAGIAFYQAVLPCTAYVLQSSLPVPMTGSGKDLCKKQGCLTVVLHQISSFIIDWALAI